MVVALVSVNFSFCRLEEKKRFLLSVALFIETGFCAILCFHPICVAICIMRGGVSVSGMIQNSVSFSQKASSSLCCAHLHMLGGHMLFCKAQNT